MGVTGPELEPELELDFDRDLVILPVLPLVMCSPFNLASRLETDADRNLVNLVNWLTFSSVVCS